MWQRANSLVLRIVPYLGSQRARQSVFLADLLLLTLKVLHNAY